MFREETWVLNFWNLLCHCWNLSHRAAFANSFFTQFLNISFLILTLITFSLSSFTFILYFLFFQLFLLSLLPSIFLSSLFIHLLSCLPIYVLSNSLNSFLAFLLLYCLFVFFFYKISLLFLSLYLLSSTPYYTHSSIPPSPF